MFFGVIALRFVYTEIKKPPFLEGFWKLAIRKPDPVILEKNSPKRRLFIWAGDYSLAQAVHQAHNKLYARYDLAPDKDLAVSLSLFIPMARLDLLRWDWVFPVLSAGTSLFAPLLPLRARWRLLTAIFY